MTRNRLLHRMEYLNTDGRNGSLWSDSSKCNEDKSTTRSSSNGTSNKKETKKRTEKKQQQQKGRLEAESETRREKNTGRESRPGCVKYSRNGTSSKLTPLIGSHQARKGTPRGIINEEDTPQRREKNAAKTTTERTETRKRTTEYQLE